MNPRVFLLEEPKADIDVSLAKEYGELRILFDRERRRSSVFRTTAFGWEILNRLKENEFDAVNDSICIAGSLIGITALIASLISIYGTISVLFYSASEARYVERRIGTEVWN